MDHQISDELARTAGLPQDRFPENQREVDIAQDVLATELERLSLNEHEKVLFDVHGISLVNEEDSNVIQSKLQEMQEEIQNMPNNQAYLQARSFSVSYTNSFLSIFLQSERYDVKSAAEKAVQHFDVKRELFGEGQILARDIRQSDLSPGAKKVLEYGHMQASSIRDCAGRAVVFVNSDYNLEGFDPIDLGQSILYYGVTFLRDKDTVRNGIVLIFYNLNNVAVQKGDLGPVYRVEKSLPARVAAVHYGYSNESLQPYITGMQLFFAKHDRFRFRPHMGTLAEFDFQLQTFGIPTESSPMSKDQTWFRTVHHQNIKVRRLWEEREQNSKAATGNSPASLEDQDKSDTLTDFCDRIGIPRRFDVILGKSSEARSHPGNRRAAHLCEMNYQKYEQAGKFGKTEVAESIISTIRQSGGRFLKWEQDEGWVEELDEVVARKKIGHFFRYIRSKSKSTAPSSSTNLDDKDIDELLTSLETTDKTSTKRVTPPPSPLNDFTEDDELPQTRNVRLRS